MIVIVDSVEDATAIRCLLLAKHAALGGRAPACWANPRIVVIGGHSGPSEVNLRRGRIDVSDDRPMTYTEAAEVAGVSTSTVKRRVAAGVLVKVGRRVTAESVRRLMRGEASE